MSYIVNQSRVHSLTIGGVDYTGALVSWTASDASANKNGYVSTTGAIELGFYPDGPLIEDYDRNNFRRGVPVILTMSNPSGGTYRHPRGLLYVISTSYEPDANSLLIEIGCRISLATLTDDDDFRDDLTANVSGLPQLDPARNTIESVGAALASVGKYVYQDNNGDIIDGVFFDGDTDSATAAGEWVSVLGVTALAASPLAGTAPIPDSIELSYSVPSDYANSQNPSRYDHVEVKSYYFLEYPAQINERINSDATTTDPNGSIANAGSISPGNEPSGVDPCGASPPQPGDIGGSSCQEGYQLTVVPKTVSAIREEYSDTYYNGPAGQQDYSETNVYGPLVETNSQYYADVYAYCIRVYASNCRPGGGCSLDGMERGHLSRTTSTNYFGNANELVKNVRESWVNIKSVAETSDWRSGTDSSGIPQNFRYLPDYLFRSQAVVTTYSKEGNTNVQDSVTYSSVANKRGGGYVDQELDVIDAYNGIQTRQVRRSTTISALDVAPDRVTQATTSTIDQKTELPLFTGRFVEPPAESGPYVMEESAPVPFIFATDTEIDAAVSNYSSYLVRFVKGDAFGLQLSEGLREEVAQNWYPGMPFRYNDPAKGRTIAMRMDATTWGVTGTESAFVTNGIWCGYSNGTVATPDNVVGNSIPTLQAGSDPLSTSSGAATPPANPTIPAPPTISNETSVDNGAKAFVVKVDITMQSLLQPASATGIVSASSLVHQVWDHSTAARKGFTTFVVNCSGFTKTGGTILSADSNGSIPVEYAGTLVTTSTVIGDADLFS